MKKLIGFLVALFGIVFILLIILRIWNITIIGWADMLRSGLTLMLLAAAVVILVVVRYLFFKEKR